MPDCYQVNNYKADESSQVVCEKKNISTPFIFSCFCSVYKIEPTVFEAWMNILKAVSESVLWITNEGTEFMKNIRKAATYNGVDPDRILLKQKLPHEKHMQRLARVDLALDTWIVNGAATTSDALWAGVPVIALKGKHFASRMSSSILNAIGMTSLITSTIEDYVSLAVEIGHSMVMARSLREEILGKRLLEPLFDTTRFVRNFEEALLKLWNCQKTGKPTHHIIIGKRLPRHSGAMS
jgi:protein O-GlcNAc transferase